MAAKNSEIAIKALPLTKVKKGYSLAQIRNRIKFIFRLNIDELKEIFIDPDTSVLEKIIANALKKDIEKGEMAALEKLLNRLFNISKTKAQGKDDFFDKIEITYVTKNIDEIKE